MVTDAHPGEHLAGNGASRDLPYIDLVDPQGNVRRSLLLSERGVTIGSAPGNLLVLEGSSVARSHVRIDWDGQSAAVQNLATRRSTTYEGTPLQANDLRVWQPGDVLQVGDYRLRLRIGGAASESEPGSSASQVTTPLSAITASAADMNGSLDLRLDSGYDLLELTPDQMVAVKLTLNNRGSSPESVLISVDGPAAAWVRTPPTPIQVRPMGSAPVMLPVTVPRKPENRAGEYEVVIRARGQNNPANTSSVIGRWTVLPFMDARLELRPPTMKLRGTNSALYTVALRNLGNVSMPFEMRVSDDQQQLEFAPNISSGVVEPGVTDERKVEVLPLRQPDDKEQTYNVRVQALANGQTYADTSTLIQRRGGIPPWAVWVIGALIGLALLLIPALFLAYRTNAQNNTNGTRVAAMEATRDSQLSLRDRTGTAISAGTQTPLAQTQAVFNMGLANGPTATVLSQMNATAIAGAAQLTAQAAMLGTIQAGGGSGATTNNNFFGDAPGSPGQSTVGAVLQTVQAASGQVSGAQTSQAVQTMAGGLAQTSAAQSGQTAAAQTNASAQAQNTAAANTQGTQSAQTNATNTANAQATSAAQTAAAQTASAVAAQTAAAQTAQAQTAQAQQQREQQTAQAQRDQQQQTQTAAAQMTSVVQTSTAFAQGTAAVQTSVASTATATVVQGAQPEKLQISAGPDSARANDDFSVTVVVIDRSGKLATSTGNNFFVNIELQNLSGVPLATFTSSSATQNGTVQVSGLKWQRSGDFVLVARSGSLTPSLPKPVKITPRSATHFSFTCFITSADSQCPTTPVTPFVVRANQKFGFVAVALDEFENIDTNFSEGSYIKIDYAGVRAAEQQMIIPPFQKGWLFYNSMDLPDKTVGNSFFFEFGSTDTQKPRAFTPVFNAIAGPPVHIYQDDPAPPAGSSLVTPFQMYQNPDPKPTFKVKVEDAKHNPVKAGVRVCFETDGDTSNKPDLTFYDDKNRSSWGRDGIWTYTDNLGIATTFKASSNSRLGSSYRLFAYTHPVETTQCDLNESIPPPSPWLSLSFFIENK